MATEDTSAIRSLLSGYPVSLAIPVQWGDQDAFRHVNNAVYFRWYESGRIAYNLRVGLVNVDPQASVGPILASTSNNFRRQVTFPDTVHVGVRASKIGRTSITFEHIIVSERIEAIAAEGASTIVVFDYQANRPRAVPNEIRIAIEALEGRRL